MKNITEIKLPEGWKRKLRKDTVVLSYKTYKVATIPYKTKSKMPQECTERLHSVWKTFDIDSFVKQNRYKMIIENNLIRVIENPSIEDDAEDIESGLFSIVNNLKMEQYQA